MNQKLVELGKKLQQIVDKNNQMNEDLVRLTNENSSKSEFLNIQEKKYAAMLKELEERKLEIINLEEEVKNYKNMDEASIRNLNADKIMIEKYLEEVTIMKEFVTLLMDENRKFDMKYAVDARSLKEEGNTIKPSQEMYAKANKPSITVKYVRKTKAAGDAEEKLTFHVTFRISNKTKFQDLKAAACDFWKVPSDSIDLTDENGAQVPQEDKIEEYFRSHGQSFQGALLVLKHREESAQLTPGILALLQGSDPQKKGKIDETSLSKDQKKEPNPYEEFFERFPGMKEYIDEDALIEKDKKPQIFPKKTRKVDDKHFCVFFWYLILFIVTIVGLQKTLNVKSDFKTILSFESLLKINSDVLTFENAFQDIKTVPEFFNYLNTTFADSLFLEDPNSNSKSLLHTHNTFVGPLRIRQVRAKKRSDCKLVSNYPFSIECFNTKYNDKTKHTDQIGTSNEPWTIYHPESETKIASKIRGLFSTYDGSGYIMDFDMAKTTRLEFKQNITNALAEKYFDWSVRAIFMTGVLYSYESDKFLRFDMGVEFTVAGSLKVLTPDIKVFDPNLYTDGDLSKASDIFRSLVVIAILVLILYMLFTNSEGKLGWNLSYIITFEGALNLAIVILVLVCISKNMKLQNKHIFTKDLVFTTDFVDLKQNADSFQLAHDLDAFIVFLLTIRLILFLRIHPTFSLLFGTLEKAALYLGKYVLTLIALIIGFAIMAMILFGPVSDDYKTLGNAFISIIGLSVGYFDTTVWRESDSVLMAVFLTFYYFFQIFFLITVFASIYIDTYRRVAMEQGEFSDGKPKTELGSIMKWLFSWVPSMDWIRERTSKISCCKGSSFKECWPRRKTNNTNIQSPKSPNTNEKKFELAFPPQI